MNIREMRKSSRMSQAALASLTGMDRTRISFAENGYVELKPEEQDAIRRAIVRELNRLATQSAALMQQCGVAV